MIGATSLASVSVVALLALLVGLTVGLAYFRALRLTVDLFAEGRGALLPLGLTLIRFAGLIAVLLLAVQIGAAALLTLFLGFLLARKIAVRPARKTS
jgi:F1F0 ATPase subunit 2